MDISASVLVANSTLTDMGNRMYIAFSPPLDSTYAISITENNCKGLEKNNNPNFCKDATA